MKLFINNKRVKLVGRNTSIKNNDYDIFLNTVDQVDLNKIHGKVFIANAKDEEIVTFLKLLEMKKFEKIKSFNFLVDSVTTSEKNIKKQFKVIKAAGGLVLKDGKVLLIHRMGVWDLPKGKLENNEIPGEGALREVEEECGIKAENISKLCVTWHSYTHKEKKILKKTTWFLMNCLNDDGLKPQLEEQIDRIEWMKPGKAEVSLADSYESIRYVLKKFKKKGRLSFFTQD